MQVDIEDYIEENGGPPRPVPPRIEILREAIEITGNLRQAQYGDVVSNMENMAYLFSAWIKVRYGVDVPLDGEDVAKMMTLVKDVRSIASATHRDNYIDSAAYSAIAYECRVMKDKRGQSC